jgi:rRNA-processing protein FCF1
LSEPRRLLVVDANVLIDYVGSDISILRLAAEFVGPIHVTGPVLKEVEQLGEADCDRLGIHLVEASTNQLLEAGAGRGRLSFSDRLCLILARDRSWTCVTNDRALRRACTDLSVPVLWGLELMLELVSLRRLTVEAALDVAMAIHRSNPRHITAEILERFERKASQR